MSEPLYDIFFRGECLEGKTPEQVKQHFAQLFKLPNDKVEVFFSGKVIALKKGLDKASTIKFKQVLEKAGAKIYIKLVATEAPAPAQDQAKQNTTPEASALNILPVGSDLLTPNERSHATAPAIDLSGISLASSFAEPVNQASEKAIVNPDISYISTAELGADMLEAQYRETAALPEVDISYLSVAETGFDLSTLNAPLETISAPDTSFISLAEPGAILSDEHKKAPPAPDTSHIKLDN